MLSITNLGKSYGAQTLFRDASLTFGRGQVYGVAGANGSGKSSLLRILAGEEEASAGAVSMPRKARVGVLRQDHFRFEDVPILDVVMMGHRPVWEAMQAKDTLLERATEHFDADRYAALEDVIMQHDGYSLEARAAEILDGLAIPADVHRKPLSTLSGGFKLRVLLAQTLAADPDVLLLDEPTNHLDLEMRLALSTALQGFEGAMLIVSHDRYLLRSVCDRFLLVDRGSMRPFDGDLDDYRRWIREQDATSTSPSEPAPAGDMRRQQRQQSAEQRRRLQPLRRRVEALERQMESLSAKRSELEDVLADAELYEAERKQELSRVLQDQAEIADRLEAVEADWLTATEELEAQLREG
jgi:ATPase subunit of ABC transporter with duplicated ATPase domains